jgi:plasmid stabilization system protein ParE
MAFQVIFQPRARSDVAAAVMWLACNNPVAAARWRAGLFRIVQKLETNPLLYPEADEATELGLDLRELLYGRRRSKYRVLFTVDDPMVNIHCVRHAAQDRLAPGDV